MLLHGAEQVWWVTEAFSGYVGLCPQPLPDGIGDIKVLLPCSGIYPPVIPSELPALGRGSGLQAVCCIFIPVARGSGTESLSSALCHSEHPRGSSKGTCAFPIPPGHLASWLLPKPVLCPCAWHSAGSFTWVLVGRS